MDLFQVILTFGLIAAGVALIEGKEKSREKRHHTRRGVSNEDIQAVQKTWPQIYRNAEENGVAILYKFLKDNDYFPMFHKFIGLPHDESIMKNPTFRRHAMIIMENLNTAILNAHTDKVEGRMKSLGAAHVARGVTQQHVDKLRDVIYDTIRSAFGFTAQENASWKNVLSLVFSYMKSSMPQ